MEATIRKRRLRIVTIACVLMCGILALGLPSANAAWLPTPNPGADGNSLQYGNFYVYSLAYLSNIASKDPDYKKNSDPFIVDSSPGRIANDVVVATGVTGNPQNQNFSGMDDAYPTPSGVSGAPYFQTSDSEPGSLGNSGDVNGLNGPWDTKGTWSSSIQDMRSFLGGQELVIYFNLNEDSSGTDPAGLARAQDLLAWARISLEDSTGTNDSLHFYVSKVVTPLPIPGFVPGVEPDPTAQPGDSGPVADPDDNDPLDGDGVFNKDDERWAYVHGEIAVNKSTGFFENYGPADSTQDEIDQNLGADQAAFALYNEQLSNLVKSSSKYDRITMDIKFAGLSNGFEQVFIRPTEIDDTQPIPEPASLLCWALLGCCALGARVVRRRKMRY